MPSAPPPLPRLHEAGVLVAKEKLAEWWLDPEDVEGRLEAIIAPEERRRSSHRRSGDEGCRELNHAWVKSARTYLARFVRPINTRGGDIYRTPLNDRGLMHEAMERIRDGRVIEGSLEGLDEGTQDGLDIGIQDVLAAIALLARIDRNAEPRELKFREGAFEPAE